MNKLNLLVFLTFGFLFSSACLAVGNIVSLSLDIQRCPKKSFEIKKIENFLKVPINDSLDYNGATFYYKQKFEFFKGHATRFLQIITYQRVKRSGFCVKRMKEKLVLVAHGSSNSLKILKEAADLQCQILNLAYEQDKPLKVYSRAKTIKFKYLKSLVVTKNGKQQQVSFQKPRCLISDITPEPAFFAKEDIPQSPCP